jgi:hypothetical protein
MAPGDAFDELGEDRGEGRALGLAVELIGFVGQR